MLAKPLLLVIDDELAILKTLKESLEDEGFRVETLSDGRKAVDEVGRLLPDLVFLDICMPNCNGLDILVKIKKEFSHQKVIIISGYGSIPIAVEAVRKEAIDFIEKPLNLDEILQKISCLKNQDNESTKKTTGFFLDYEKFGIVGKSYLFQEFMYELSKIAPLKLPVMIYGSFGSGKSLFAEFVHKNSSFADGKFLAIECDEKNNALNFDNIKTAFKNSYGTLFLKNIQALKLQEQAKLLEFLNNYSTNIRLICSAKNSLFKMVQNNTFLETLFYKINIAPIEIASLNKRKFDIPLLVNHFLKQYCTSNNKTVCLADSAMRSLRNHNWHGGVAQLKQLIELLVTTNKNGKIITAMDLCKTLPSNETVIVEEQLFNQFDSLQKAVDCFERNFILYSLKKNKYDLSQTSNFLNLDISNLRDKLVALNISVKS